MIVVLALLAIGFMGGLITGARIFIGIERRGKH
jgi:VIT1/CCC1 family predicted Fe2+/Mn2+ transporter